MKLEITFKSGVQVSVDVSKFTTKRAGTELTEMEWTTPQRWSRKLHSIDLTQVVCIVAVDR